MDEQRAWIKSRRRKRLRITAVALCVCLLVTVRPDILETFSTFASEWKDSTVYVSGFAELPEEVREQTVPLGTGVEELSLPDTLEAFAETPEEEGKPGDEDKPGDGNGDTENPGVGEGGTENPGDGEGGTENPGIGEGGTENPGEGTGGSENPGEGTGSGSGDAGTPGEGAGGGNGDAGNPGEGADGGNGDSGNPGEGSDGENGDAGTPGGGSDGGSGDSGTSGEENDGGSGDNGTPGEGNDGGSGDAGTPSEGNDGDSGDSETSDEGNSGEGEPETHSDSAPADGATAADEMAKESDGALTLQRGVFVMPVYLSEPVDTMEPQTMERKAESIMIKNVTWQAEPAYDGDTAGTYLFTAVLPDGYAPEEGVNLPQITVTVQGEDPVVQELLARIMVLPDAEAYLAGEPDVEEKEAYETWMDGFSAYTAEAFALWEMYETLTEEQRAQIPTEALEKLAAWVELAGRLAEDNAGILADAAEGTGTITLTLLLDNKAWTETQGVELRPAAGGAIIKAASTGGGVYEAEVETGSDYLVYVNGANVEKDSPLHAGEARTLYYRTVVYEKEDAGGTAPSPVKRYCGGIGLPVPATWTYTVSTSCWLEKPGRSHIGWSETSGGSKAETIAIDPRGETPVTLYPVFGMPTLTIKTEHCKPAGMTADENGVYKVTVGDEEYYSVTFEPDAGYQAPTYLTVLSYGGHTFPNYTYTDGVLRIRISDIKSNLTITARAVDGDGWISFGEGYTIRWKLENNTLTISGEGKMPENWGGFDAPWFYDRGKITKIVIEKGVENISNNAFLGVSEREVSIPDSVTSIGNDAFDQCHYLQTVTIPDSVTAMGSSVFASCNSLKSVTLPKGVTSIGSAMFSGCSALTAVDIPGGVTGIGSRAFSGCQSLTSVDIPGGVTGIGSSAFDGCRSLTSVIIPGKVKSIDAQSFANCTALESVTFQGTDTIPEMKYANAFANSPCVADGAKGILVPTCKYVKGKGWAPYLDHVKRLDSDSLHKMPLAETEENPAACGTEGQEAYWTCKECGTLFSDAVGTAVITEPVTIPAKEHELRYAADVTAGTITESCGNRCDHSVTATFDGSDTQTYTGSEIKPFAVRYSPGADAWLGETRPAISYAGNRNAGTATATLSLGSVSVNKNFTISPKSLADSSVTVTLPADSYQYTGKAIEPAVTVSDSAIGGTALVENTDYTVAYADNTAVGTNTAKVTVTGTGNYKGARTLTFTIQDKAPEVSGDNLDLSGGTVKLPDDIKDKVQNGEVEIYDSNGNKITPNPDGSLPVEPGTTIKIKYPGSNQETEIQIPPRPAAPAPVDKKEIEKTDTTIKVPVPDDDKTYEFVLVEKGTEPDWSQSNTTGEFTGLDPNKEYDLYMRKQATEDSFASEPVKTEIRTSVTVKEPEAGGAGADKPGNDVSGGKPGADGSSVTYTGTCEKGSTPVIIVDGKEITPDITWDADGEKGTWSYTVPVKDGDSEVGIRVEFKDRGYTGLEIEPGSLDIYADNAANRSADTLLDYLKAHCTVKAMYDNGTSDDATTGADYKVNRDHNARGAGYEYTVEANADTGKVTLTVNPVNAAVEAPDALTRTKQPGGYSRAEVDAWLPAEVTVTYTGAGGYAQRTKSAPVTWKTDALGADFGASASSKTISGTVALPEWATGGNTVSIGIAFADRGTLTDDQMNLSISGWAYGALAAPAPRGSVTVTDTEQTYTYRYRAGNSTAWVAAGDLPKSGSGNIIPGDYQVEMTYTGRSYTGTKTAVFTVVPKPVTAEKGTLAAENRRYDGTTKATLKAGGKPALSGVVGKDDVSLGGTLKAVFTNKGPKKDIPVTVTGFAMTGSDAGCYKLINTTLTLRATINNKDGSSPSSGSSGSGNSGNNGGGNSGSNTGGSTGNGSSNGSTGTGGSTGTSANKGGTGGTTGIGGNKGGIGGSTGIGGNKGGTGGATGTGSSKGSVGSGSSTGGTGKGTTTGTGKGSTAGAGKGTSGTGKGSTSKGTIGNGGTGGISTGDAESGGIDGTGRGSGNGSSDAGNAGGTQAESVTVQTVQAAADDGRIVLPDGTEAPVVIGTLTEDAPGATRLMVGEGTVTVTVVCGDDQYTVGMNDATAVANAVLTPEQIRLVDSGESLEIRVDIKNIAQSIPEQDRETVEKGYEAYRKYLSELKRGGYVDISVYMKTGEGGWNAVSETSEPMEVVIGIPKDLLGEGREYYVIRAHEGRYSLLNDMDDVPETITIVTDMFSSYAIAFREAKDAGAGNGETAYGQSRISPNFLRIVCFILVIAAAAGIVVVVIARRRKRRG